MTTVREINDLPGLAGLAAHDSWEGYWATRQVRWRNNVSRGEKKLVGCGNVTYIRYRPPQTDGAGKSGR